MSKGCGRCDHNGDITSTIRCGCLPVAPRTTAEAKAGVTLCPHMNEWIECRQCLKEEWTIPPEPEVAPKPTPDMELAQKISERCLKTKLVQESTAHQERTVIVGFDTKKCAALISKSFSKQQERIRQLEEGLRGAINAFRRDDGYGVDISLLPGEFVRGWQAGNFFCSRDCGHGGCTVNYIPAGTKCFACKKLIGAE